ncbi:MAG: T9SS type A sorting domain-containing protein, partial [bacterium]
TGEPTSPVDAPDITNHIPTLSWTGEVNYISDGLDPEVGPRETGFVYRVKYTDEDNDPPASGYPKLHIKKGGSDIGVFAMDQVDLGDNTYSDGKLYTYTKSGLEPGTDYTYYFEANDIWNIPATGDPTNSVDGPDVTNRAPTLSWTGEVNYTSDGLDPEVGPRETSFVYRVNYADEENDAPASGYPKLHIMKGGSEISGSPFTMDEVDSGDNTYSDGKLYAYAKDGLTPGENYTYYFDARDSWGSQAIGDPTNAVDAPDVTNLVPTLSWTGETNYTADGLNPETGYPDTNFIYRVNYADAENDAPAPGYPRLHIKKAGKEISGSPFTINEADSGDKDYTDGKLYTYSKIGLGPGDDYVYYFEAKDLWDGAATGEPTNAVDAPDITNHAPTLSWTGETNYTEDGLNPEIGSHYTDFTYRINYTDPNNDAPASGYPKLHIKRGGIEIDGSPFAMQEVNTGDKNYKDGKLYTYTKGRLPMGTDYAYYFEAKDLWGDVATGDPTTAIDAPDVLIGFSAIGQVKIQGGENGYVNPLKGEEAEIHFWPSAPGTVNVEIFDLIGLLVWEKSKAVTGVQDSIKWNCRNKENDLVASGIYVVYVKGPGIKATKKVAVMK